MGDYENLPALSSEMKRDPVTMAKVTTRADGMKMIEYNISMNLNSVSYF